VLSFSIITVCFNSAATIGDTIDSVANQLYPGVEHIIVDGCSTDGTLQLLDRASSEGRIRYISEADKGIYDAMNKGVALARGDVILFLNADDFLADSRVLIDVEECFRRSSSQSVCGGVTLVSQDLSPLRAWMPSGLLKFERVGQVPHPAFFVRRSVLSQLAPAFDSNYRIAADLKQQLRLFRELGITSATINRNCTMMRAGGASTASLGSHLHGFLEARRAYQEIVGFGGSLFAFKKVFLKWLDNVFAASGELAPADRWWEPERRLP
jgi:glycosyltransferase involved in cell wall biosynthesis